MSSPEQSQVTITEYTFVEKPADEGEVSLEESKGWKPKYINPLMEDWETIQSSMNAVGLKMFRRMFETHPHMKDLFSFGHDPELEKNEKVTRHAALVLTTVGHVVGGFHNSKVLSGSLSGLGGLHRHQFKVKEEHFAPFGDALIFAVSDTLPEWNEEKEAMWQGVFNQVSAIMTAQ